MDDLILQGVEPDLLLFDNNETLQVLDTEVEIVLFDIAPAPAPVVV